MPTSALAPRHVAIILDGNGRWAQQQGLSRSEGHREGARAVREVVAHARERGVEVLSLFAFSSLNFGRSTEEVQGLMALLAHYLETEGPQLVAQGIRLVGIGEREYLSPAVRQKLTEVERATAGGEAMTLVLAASYDGRRDLLRAVQRLTLLANRHELLPADVTEPQLLAALSTGALPEVDLLIRSSGEQRLSGFLPIEACYAELIFVPTLWPDFTPAHFDDCLAEYHRRERRFGRPSHSADLSI